MKKNLLTIFILLLFVHSSIFAETSCFTGNLFENESSNLCPRYESLATSYEYRAHQYDPHIYRFSSYDLITGQLTEPLTLHKYLYCLNDPVNRIDPAGSLVALLIINIK